MKEPNTQSDNEAYLEYMTDQASDGELSQLSNLASLQADVEAQMADLEAELNRARETHKDLSERQIPELMDNIGIEEFKTNTGLKISIAETIRASIPKAKAPLAFAWLREKGHAALIKRAISVSFGRGEEAAADEFAQKLTDEAVEYGDKSAVHPSTLSAFVREQLAEGEEIPIDLFGVHRQRASKIKYAK